MKHAIYRLHSAAVALALAACHDSAPPPPAKAVGPAPVPVTVTPVRTASWDQTVTIVGTLYPKDEATLGAEVEGSVEKTFIEFGERVKAGQDLATIDSDTYEALLQERKGNLARAEANLANARQNLARSLKLADTGAVSDSDLDTAKSLVAQSEAEVAASRGVVSVAELNLRHAHVKAPFDGAIASRIVGRGDFVKVGGPLFTVVNDRVLKFIFQVPERYGSQITQELDVAFSVDNYPGETFKGKVYLISPVVSTDTRSFNVGALVANAELRLKASTFARGALTLQRGVATPVVPLDAVVNYAGLSKVFVVEGGKAHSRIVKVGRVQQGDQEILDGVKTGESVVLTGQSKLTDGAPVAISTAEKPAQAAGNNP